MPDRSGLDLLKKLREENCPAPVFVTSANGDIATAVEAVRSGAFDFIEKPFDGDDVVGRMEAAIDELAQSGDELPGSPHVPGCAPFTRPRTRGAGANCGRRDQQGSRAASWA